MSYSEESEFYKRRDKWRRSSVCIVKLKNDLNIFARPRRISTMDDSSLIDKEAVYFRYDEQFLQCFGKYSVAGSADGDPEIYKMETNSKKYFFLLQEDMKEGNEAEVSELYTNLVLRMILEKPVTVVQVEPADYKEAFENDPNLVWLPGKTSRILSCLNPVICMFFEKNQMDQFYAALTERNRAFFMNEEPGHLTQFVKMIEKTAEERPKGDSFRYQHFEAFSAALLHLLKTSSYIPGKAQETQRCAKHRIVCWFSPTFYITYNGNYSKYPGVFEELQANLFHLHLTRLVYQNCFGNKWVWMEPKRMYWNPSNFGWVICEVIETKLSEIDTIQREVETLFVETPEGDFSNSKKIFVQRYLENLQLWKNFRKFILHDYPSIMKDKRKPEYTFDYYTKHVLKIETLFKENYEDLRWDKFLDWSTLGFYVNHMSKYRCLDSSVIMDTINITTAVLAMYPEEKGERRKDTANSLLKYLDKYFVLGTLREECIISEEKETDNFKEMQEILATCFRLPDQPSESGTFEQCSQRYHFNDVSDVSSELPLDRIYELYYQSKRSKKEVNPSAGLLWLGIAHRQAIGSLGELSEKQQTNCLEMLESALNGLPLQTIETFFSAIQDFATRKTVATDILQEKIPQNVDNITPDGGKTLEQKQASLKEIEERITAYIARRKKEETAVLFLLHSEIGIEAVKFNANVARYEKGHTTSAGIFIFMTLFEYNDVILDCKSGSNKKTFDYYVLTFTKYLINNPKVKDIFNKKNQLRCAVREHISRCHKFASEQLNDLLTLDWQTYYNRWIAEKPVIGKFDLDLIKYGEKDKIGSGAYGITYACHYSDFVFPIVYKEFSDISAFHSIVRELNSLMKVQSHPHVVRIFGVVTDQLNKAKGLMMEYCEGGSLDKLIEKSDYTYDGKNTVHWMAQAASALIFFLKTGVVHLDIKPANMLLCKDHHYLKIADMGITLLAEIQDKIKFEPSISQKKKFPVTASKLGTNGFMAPEVMGSAKEKMVCSYASDIFSLGRTLWSIYYEQHPCDKIVNQTVIMPVFLNPIFDATDIPEDQTPQAVENITADMKKTLEQATMKSHDDVKLECPEKIAKWIIRMTRFNPDARPTAVILHEEFKKQYEEYIRMETMTPLQITSSTKITFSHPIEVNRSVGIMLKNTSKTEILQWSASSSNEKIAVVPAEGEIPPSEVVKVMLTYGEQSVIKENMGNFIVNYRIKMDTDKPEKEWPWASKQLKIVCNL